MTKRGSILITTRNRLSDLKLTLSRLEDQINDESIEFLICDDGSTDGTHDFLQKKFPSIVLVRNLTARGLIFSRNRLLGMVTSAYAISLDDDAYFLTSDVWSPVEEFFKGHPTCGVIAFRIFWGKDEPHSTENNEEPHRVKSFVGCGHVWRMVAWKSIPPYPDWFIFYGEEEFASFELYKRNWGIYYLPDVLVHHRVFVKERRQEDDYFERLRRSLRAGWYNYFLFLPLAVIPRKFLYSLWIQLKFKVFIGEVKTLLPLFLALGDLIRNSRKIISNANRLSLEEYNRYTKLAETKIYWKPNE